jgi:hypothetical protein
MLFRPITGQPADVKVAPARKHLSLEMDDAIQYRCAGAIQAAIERQTDLGDDDDASSDSSSALTAVDEDANPIGAGQQGNGKKGENRV